MSVNKLQNKKKPLKTVPGNASTATKSRGFVHNATDTFHELALLFLAVIVVGGLAYSLFESKGVLDGFWWALVTAFTVGYGDVVPTTMAGRVVAGLLMTVSVFIIVPLITARMASKMIVNDDAFTHKEQENIKATNARLNAWLDEQDGKKQLTIRHTTGTLKAVNVKATSVTKDKSKKKK